MAKCRWTLKGKTYKWFDLGCAENYPLELPYETVAILSKFGRLKYCVYCGKEIMTLEDKLKEANNE